MLATRRPSHATIAKSVGVSRAVVGAVLNGREGKGIFFSAETREKVLRTAQEVGYVAPKSVKELFTGRSDTIGVIVHDLEPPMSDLLRHILVEARKKGLEVIPYFAGWDAEIEERFLGQTRDGRVDAMIAIGLVEGSLERYLRYITTLPRQKILVYNEPLTGLPTVHFDEPAAGRLAAQHLMETGRRRLAFIGPGPGLPRGAAFADHLREHGISSPTVLKPEDFACKFSAAVKVSRTLLKSTPAPDGVFATDDFWAISLLIAARERGMKVPDDVAIMGCDNIEACEYTTPGITSIDTDRAAVARALIARVARMINGQDVEPAHKPIPVKLVVRESTLGNGFRDETGFISPADSAEKEVGVMT